MAIKLKLSKDLFVPKYFPLLFDYSKRWEVYMGSAGSAKSYFVTQKLIARACNERIKILVCRRYGSTIRNTCFSLFKEILMKWKLLPYVNIRETDFNIRFCNGSEIIFMGLDDECKLLSLNGIGTIFVEETFEVPKNIVEQLNLRMRSNTPNQQIIMCFNPISQQSWLYDFCVKNPPESFRYTHSTYRDNPFLPASYVKELEELYERNPQKARVFCDGEWGIDYDGLVFQNWKEEEFDAMELAAKGYQRRAGCDMGYTDPSTILDTLYNRENKTIYIYNEFYKSGCQLDEIVSAFQEMNLTRTKVYIDSAEPRTIAYFRQKGINAEKSAKGKDSVRASIMFLQNHKIVVHPSCKSTIMELSNFSYIKSKITGQYTEDTTHEYSHAISALRYAYCDIYSQTKLKTIDKAVLSL